MPERTARAKTAADESDVAGETPERDCVGRRLAPYAISAVSSLRTALFFSIVVGIVAVSITSVLRALFPGCYDSPRTRFRLRVGVAIVMSSVVVLEVLARRYAPAGGGAFRIPVALSRSFLLTALTAALGVRVVRLVEWISVRAERFFIKTASTPPVVPAAPIQPQPLTRREALVRAGAFSIAGVATGASAFGGLRLARDLQVREIEVYIPDLAPSLEGFTLLQLTDLHVGIFTGPRDFAAIVERTRALRADVVVFTGDLLDNNPAHVPEAMRLFSQINGRYGRYAVLGNHDYYTGHEAVLDGLRRAGIPPLVNRGLVIPSGTRHPGIALLGVDDVVARRIPGRGPNLSRALQTVPIDAPRILLAHNPVLFSDYAGHVALQLSGHTHGGQINPGEIARLVLRYVSGRYERNGSVLYVSNGSGLTGPPVRLFAPPELVRIGLTGRRRV